MCSFIMYLAPLILEKKITRDAEDYVNTDMEKYYSGLRAPK